MEKAQGAVEKVAGRLANTAGRPIDSTEPKADTVDLSSDMVALLRARNEFQSNARVIKTGDDMQKTLLNLLA
jgi:flagellar basal body rod protein FlgG